MDILKSKYIQDGKVNIPKTMKLHAMDIYIMKKWSNPTYSEKVLTQSDIFTWKKIINPLKNVNNIYR